MPAPTHVRARGLAQRPARSHGPRPSLAGALAVAALATLAASSASAQQGDYPNRPIRLMTPNAPGSSIDTLGRIVAQRLGEALGQTLIVENRAGAGGTIGMEAVKTAPPDGYMLAVASASSLSTAPVVQKSVPYDPVTDFGFVSRFAVMPNVLVVNNALPVRTVKELIDQARAAGGKLNMASAGPGAASHLGGVLLMSMAGFESLHVPYKGGGPSVASVVSGETQWTITPAPAAMSLVKGGRVRAIAHSLDKRSALFGDMPTVAETVPGYDYSGWAGIVGPRSMPGPVVERIRAALARAAATPAFREALAAQGAETVVETPDEFRAFVERDLANTRRIAKVAQLAPE